MSQPAREHPDTPLLLWEWAMLLERGESERPQDEQERGWHVSYIIIIQVLNSRRLRQLIIHDFH